jgi:hypothetical protein
MAIRAMVADDRSAVPSGAWQDTINLPCHLSKNPFGPFIVMPP